VVGARARGGPCRARGPPEPGTPYPAPHGPAAKPTHRAPAPPPADRSADRGPAFDAALDRGGGVKRQGLGRLSRLLGRFRRVGHRITGGRRGQSRRAGWEFWHVCIDDHSRLAYVERLDNERAETTTQFLRRAVRWFARQGIRTERVMSDDGSGYVAHAFAATCRELGVRHLRTRPHSPRTNEGPSASSRPCSASGPPHARSARRTRERSASPPGCATTTAEDPIRL
jgi:transposase InsO family protein